MIFKLKITTTTPSAKLSMLIHKKTALSVSNIKQICETGDTIYECDSADTQGLIVLNDLNKEIKNLGFETQMFIDDKQVSSEMFINIEKRNIEIDAE